jgi:creatinine amidohydrolase
MLGVNEGDITRLTWEDAGEALDRADYVVLPLGSIEQHSTHLPVSVDSLRAENLTRELVEAAPDHDMELLRLPTLPYGYSEHHSRFPGTVTLDADTYQRALVQIGESLARHDAARLCMVNFHGGNRQPMKLAADRIQRDHGLRTHVVGWTDFARDRLEEEFGDEWGHAGEHETSAIKHYHPDLVHEDRAEPQTNRDERWRTRQYAFFDELTAQGGLSDPTAADAEFFAEVVEETTADILGALAAERNTSLPDPDGSVRHDGPAISADE